MSTLYEYYNTNDDTADGGYYAYWIAQTFTPTIAHKITSVKLKLYRAGDVGTVTVSIRATTSGLPSGNDLCSGTIAGNTLTTDTAGAWYEITLGAGLNLVANTKYAIVLRAPDNDYPIYVGWRSDDTAPAYAGGSHCYSSDSGGSWAATTTRDFMFEEWGELVAAVGRSFGYIIG